MFPWNLENAPIKIRIKGRRILGWRLYNETAGSLPFSIPFAQPVGEVETITLIPYGCSTLRIANFPLIGEYTVMY